MTDPKMKRQDNFTRDYRLMAAEPQDRLVTVATLPLYGVNYHTNHLRRMWNDGRFPKPFHLSVRKLAWKESTIRAWIAEKIGA